jgi:heat shock protein HtpX
VSLITLLADYQALKIVRANMLLIRTVILWLSTVFLILLGTTIFLGITNISPVWPFNFWLAGFILFLIAGSASLILSTSFILKWFYSCRQLDNKVTIMEFRMVLALRKLARESGLPEPVLYLQARDEVNAFSMGFRPEKSYIVLTQGLVDQLSLKKVMAIMAHELMHIRNGDMRNLSLMQATLYLVSSLPANLIYFVIERGLFRRNSPSILYFLVYSFCYIAMAWPAGLFVSWYSRRQEYKADREGAELIGQDSMSDVLQILRPGEINESVSNYFLAFKSPHSALSYFKKLFSTHASLEERLAALHQKNKVIMRQGDKRDIN